MKKNIRRNISLTLVLMMLISVLAGCSSSNEAPPAGNNSDPGQSGEVNEIVIGGLFPLTGPTSPTGKAAVDGIELAIDIINGSYDLDLPFAKEEGLPNLNGAKLKMIVSDTQGVPEKAQTIMEKLINDENVVVVQGAYHSSVVAAAAVVSERYSIPFVSGDASSPALTTSGYKWFFRTCPHDGIIAEGFFKFMDDLNVSKNAGLKDVVIIAENTNWGTNSAKVEKEMAEKYGYNVVGEISYDSKASEFSSEILKVKSFNPDAVIHSSYVADSLMMIKHYKQNNYAPFILGNGGGFVDPSFIQTLGADAENLITMTGFTDDLKGREEVIDTVKKMFFDKYGYDMIETAARDFNNTMVIADAINRAGSTDPEAIRQALIETDIPKEDLIVAYEGVKFDENQQNSLARMAVVQIQNGQYASVFPKEIAGNELIYPIPQWSER